MLMVTITKIEASWTSQSNTKWKGSCF